MREMSNEPSIGGIGCAIAAVVAVVLVSVGGCLWAMPQYGVYRQTLAGQAALREAESSRQIAVEEARAKKEAAKMLAEAEIERAKGVAEANKIIGESLDGNEAYLRYLWIQGLENGTAPTIVYVPTEAGLPILEASRLPKGE